MLRVLELGNYVVPAYCGMVLAEQGHEVVKWTNGRDPILGCHRGDELWAWINEGKQLANRHPREVRAVAPGFDIILDNFRPATLERWGIDPPAIAAACDAVWVSMRPDVGERSFDLIAQARAWMDFCPWVPFWIGDTAGGLWLAFKALAMHAAGRRGHFVLRQAACLAKLVEGELVVDARRPFGGPIPWEAEPYHVEDGMAVVQYKGETIREPIRDRAWRLAHLKHRHGRLII